MMMMIEWYLGKVIMPKKIYKSRKISKTKRITMKIKITTLVDTQLPQMKMM